MRPFDPRKAALVWTAAFLASAALFTLWPALDISVSSLFYRPGEGFWLSHVTALEIVRQLVFFLTVAMALLALLGALMSAFGRPMPGLGGRESWFVLLLFLIGPALLADGILKRFWGRARPANTELFGGDRSFTPALVPADQCEANCSFVSGEGAGATALAIALIVLAPAVRRVAPRWLYHTYLVMAVAVPATGIALRVILGRHFLSDTVFAMLLVSGVALILWSVLNPARRG